MFSTLRHAARSVACAPLWNLLIALCIGLGAGATTTVFAWVQHLVRRPLPAVESMESVVTVVTRAQGQEGGVSYPDYLDWRDSTTTLRGLAAFGIRQAGLRAAGERSEETQSTWGLLISENYFEVLGVRLAAGRTFSAAECRDIGRAPVAIISHRAAKRFGGAAAAIGRELRVNDVRFTVVGVAPADFVGTYAGLSFDLWVPVTMHPRIGGETRALEAREVRWLQAIGRLQDGVLLDEAQEELGAVSRRIGRTHPENEGREAFVKPLDTGAARRLGRLFTVLLAMTGLVALIVCSNVANLLMLRGSARAHEFGIRLSLGASPSQVVAQLLVESTLLALAGAVLAALVSRWAQGLLPALMPPSPLPLALEGASDPRTLLFALGVAAVMVALFGIVPALHTLRGAVIPSSSGGRIGTTRGAARLRSVLVVAQLSLSMAALACAGAFLRVNSQLAAIDRGLRAPDQVFIVSTDLDQAGFSSDEARVQASERLLSEARALPGVESAALATFVPLGFTGYSTVPVTVPGYSPRDDEDMNVSSNYVSSDYFRTLGIAIREGRAIDDRDRDASTQVVVVNETFVRRFLPATTAVGRQIEVGSSPVTVVGVAADGKYRFDALDEPSPPFIYLAYHQQSRAIVTLHLRTEERHRDLLRELRPAVAAVSPALPLNAPTTLDEYTSLPLFPVRVGTSVLACLGCLALLLASTGLYGVLAYRVTRCWKEFAVRVALGATAPSLLKLVLSDGLRQALAGVSLGTLLAAGTIRLVALRLPHIGSVDPMLLAMAAGAIALVALIAALIPAFRASRIQPSPALRGE